MSKNVASARAAPSCPLTGVQAPRPRAATPVFQPHVESRITKNHAVISELIAKLRAEHARIDQSNITVDLLMIFVSLGEDLEEL